MLNSGLQSLSDPLGDAEGGLILRMDEADDAIRLQGGEGVGQGRPRRFGRIAVPPLCAAPASRRARIRPAFGRGEAGHPQKGASHFVLQRPHAGALPYSTPQEERQVSPGPGAIPGRLSGGQVPHDLRVRVEPRIVVDVVWRERAGVAGGGLPGSGFPRYS